MIDGSGAGAPLVLASTARVEDLVSLRDAGIGSRAIAAAAGVSRRTVSDIGSGRRARTTEDVSGRLLGVRADDVAPGRYRLVDAGPTLERVARLHELGYSSAWIAVELGSRAARPRLQIGLTVSVRTQRAVAELFECVGSRPGPGQPRSANG